MKYFVLSWLRKRYVFVSAVLLLASAKSYSQYVFFGKPVYEIGINIGPSNFLGDVGGNQGKGRTFIKDNNIEMTKLMKGLYFTVRPSEFIGFNLAANFGTVEGWDSIIVSKGGLEDARKDRNLGFRSSLWEVGLTTEIYPTVLLEEDDQDLVHKFRPYATIGVGVFHFDPKGLYDGPYGQEWVKLQPLHTEGQGMPNHPGRKPYNLTQLNLPMGVGLKYYFSQTINVGVEVLLRKTFTDYIDDVSTTYIDPNDFYTYFGAGSYTAQVAEAMSNKAVGGYSRPAYGPGDKRGTTTNNDAYFSATLKLGIRLGGDGSNNYTSQTRCPVLRF